MGRMREDQKKIFVCTHDTLLYTHIEMCIHRYSLNEVTLCYFGVGKLLVDEAKHTGCDVLFLDTGLKDVPYTDLVRQLRLIDPNILLILLSDNAEEAFYGYELRAFWCLRKAAIHKELDICIPALLRELGIGRRVVQFMVSDRMHLAYADEILFAESRYHAVLIHYRGKHKEPSPISDSLTDIAQILAPYGFSRIHHSFVVNMDYLVDVSGEWAILDSGQEIPISRHLHHELLMLVKAKKAAKKEPK